MKRKIKGISIIEILVVVLLTSISLFVILQSMTGISMAILKQTEFLNCLSIAKTQMDIYSYYPRGSIGPANKNYTTNIGSLRYNVTIIVENFGNHTVNLNLRRLIITVSSPRVKNLRVRLSTLI